MKDQIIKFWRDEEGATAIEYALIAGLIAVGLALALTNLGTELSSFFGRIGTKLKGITIA
ncbi:MAG: Flp family type IVb pilin [Comamonas testosteroni]|uniref:Flp family type IVb pilin n=1 Tax=Comamonas testosteroni TaxID=285 RepID=UPI0031D80B68